MAGLRFLGGGVIQFTDNSGNPLAAGTINTYITGTTTDKTTYSDSARTTPNANPITLDSNGKAVIYLMNNGEYRFLLKTSAGATVDTIDNVSGQVRTHQGCLVTKTGTTSTNNISITAIPFDSETYDTGAYHDTATNNTRITIPTASAITRVTLGATLVWASNATGVRAITIRKNGGTTVSQAFMLAAPVGAGGNVTSLTISTPVLVVVEGDYFEVTGFQESGGALNVTSACQFWMEVIE